MKKLFKIISSVLVLASVMSSLSALAATNASSESQTNAIDPTQWVAVDGLGRELTTYEEAGDKKEKYVGVFYWTWHQELRKAQPSTNLTEFIAKYPDAKNDYDHEAWKQTAGAYFWDEPIYGYYAGADSYVLRKQAELLADADVDFVVFDCTNASYTWDATYLRLLKVWSEAKEDGVDVPQITFMLNFAPIPDTAVSLKNIYRKLYSKEKYKDLWFYWDGKPLMIAHPEILDVSDENEKEIYDFFTWRRNEASYFSSDKSNKYWGWLSVYPQALYKQRDKVEMTTVGVAMNADYTANELTAMNGENIMGRSYAKGDYSYSYVYKGKTVTVDENIENSSMYGRNFQQQWDYAIENDPELIFITGWNEWTATRHPEWGGVENGFPDQFTDEYSRDVEPTKGALKDHYYNQLVSNIRRFKGVGKTEYYSSNVTIDINGDVSQWDSDRIAVFNHYTDSTYDRSTLGYGNVKYTNETMRNDIVQARVAYDASNVYFYVRTEDELSPATDTAWMRLLIDTQPATAEGKAWEEYEYIINRVNPGEKATLERSTGGWNWEKVAEVDYSVNGNVLQIAVPRSALGLTDSLDFNFKWSDNMQTDGDIMDFYTNGDVAPGARFMFDFNVSKSDVPTVDETENTENVGTDTVTQSGDATGDGASEKSNTAVTVIAVVAVAVVAIAATVFIIIKKKKK